MYSSILLYFITAGFLMKFFQYPRQSLCRRTCSQRLFIIAPFRNQLDENPKLVSRVKGEAGWPISPVLIPPLPSSVLPPPPPPEHVDDLVSEVRGMTVSSMAGGQLWPL
jgi:hypothetical protein